MGRPRKKLTNSEPNLARIRREMRAGFDRVMEKLERDYQGGHESALLIAVEMCLMHAAMWGTSPPQWVVDAYSGRLWRFMNNEVASLDEAFGTVSESPLSSEH